MRSLEVVIDLTPADAGATPDVRCFVDRGSTSDLDGETELSLAITQRWRWQGTLLVAHRGGFFYRLGISALGGADWSLRIHDPGRRCDVLVDGDAITTGKCWLVGSCELQSDAPERVQRKPAAASAEQARIASVTPLRRLGATRRE